MKKNDIFIMSIFFIVSIFISLILNNLESAYNTIKENNILHSDDAIVMEVNGSKLEYNDFFNVIKNTDNLYLEANDIKCSTYYGNAIYCNYKINNIPPLIQGEFFKFDKDDYEKKCCVIGKNLENLVKVIDNKKYVSIENNDYLVIGIMGSNDRTTAFDDIFYININKDIFPKIINSRWLIDGYNPQSSYSIIKDKILLINEGANVTQSNKEESKTSLTKVIEDRSYVIAVLVLVILTLLLNVVNSTSHYIMRKKKEFGIRRTFGATKFSIYKKIILDYQIMAVKSFIFSQIVYTIIIKVNNVPYILGEQINLKASLYTFFILLIIGTIVAIIPIKESNKYEPSEVMKGI
ncbi:MAG: ABC transporter permease [Clostridium sp.]|nr:ABC transporter permease [Clostridium sp.]